jgi:hypothetical protein
MRNYGTDGIKQLPGNLSIKLSQNNYRRDIMQSLDIIKAKILKDYKLIITIKFLKNE